MHIKKILYSFVGKENIPNVVNEEEYIEKINEDKNGKVFDILFIVSSVLCVAFMVFLEIG